MLWGTVWYCRVLLSTAGYYWLLRGTGWYWGALGGTKGTRGVLTGTLGYCRVLGGTAENWGVLEVLGSNKGYWGIQWSTAVMRGTVGYRWVILGVGGYWGRGYKREMGIQRGNGVSMEYRNVLEGSAWYLVLQFPVTCGTLYPSVFCTL